MRLIADSGSTKTDWCLTHKGEIVRRISTQGINPFHQSEQEITDTIRSMADQLESPSSIHQIDFYGAGCGLPDKIAIVTRSLESIFPDCTHINVSSDLLGAAIATCGNRAGIACILGTGSNSCQFDGSHIVKNTPSLGYILGDEGSGATLGRALVSDCLKGQLPPHICQAFRDEYGLDQATILERVYRQPLANRFLASLTPFLHKHRTDPSVHTWLVGQFKLFFERNIIHSYDTDLPIHFIGSIAYYFREELTEAATNYELRIGDIYRTPMEGMIKGDGVAFGL